MNRYTTRPDLLKMMQRYHQGSATEAEKAFVDHYYAYFNNKAVEGEQLDVAEQARLQKEIEVWLLDYINKPHEPVKEKPAVQLWPQPALSWFRRVVVGGAALSTPWKIAAAVAAISLGVWLYTNEIASSRKAPRNDEVVVNDIAPGKNTATLTLADGKVINLDTNRTSVTVADSVKTMTMLTASTPRGGTYQVKLPDGTRVWLNSDSKLFFPSQFSGKERKILLDGEAYFEVAKAFVIQSSAKDLKKRVRQPFIVETAGSGDRPGQRVEVLGTHFNINSYADEGGIKTTLLEGSVRISSLLSSQARAELGSVSLRGRTEAQGGPSLREGTTKQPRGPSTTQIIFLKPNQQAILDKHLQVRAIDPSEAIAWKEGNFVFNDEDLESILRKVARWYDVEIVYESKPVGVSLLGEVSRSKNVSAVLYALEQTGKVHFRIEGRRIVVMK